MLSLFVECGRKDKNGRKRPLELSIPLDWTVADLRHVIAVHTGTPTSHSERLTLKLDSLVLSDYDDTQPLTPLLHDWDIIRVCNWVKNSSAADYALCKRVVNGIVMTGEEGLGNRLAQALDSDLLDEEYHDTLVQMGIDMEGDESKCVHKLALVKSLLDWYEGTGLGRGTVQYLPEKNKRHSKQLQNASRRGSSGRNTPSRSSRQGSPGPWSEGRRLPTGAAPDTPASIKKQRKKQKKKQRKERNRVFRERLGELHDTEVIVPVEEVVALDINETSTTIAQYPTQSLGEEDANKLGNCSICLCDYGEGEQVTRLPCFHTFHSECINRWLEASGKCPQDMLDMSQLNHSHVL